MHMKDDSKFYWEDDTPVADTFSAWNSGEPNYLKTGKCAYMYVSGGEQGKGIITTVMRKTLLFAKSTFKAASSFPVTNLLI